MENFKLHIFLLFIFLTFLKNVQATNFEYENCLENNPKEAEEFDFIVGKLTLYIFSMENN